MLKNYAFYLLHQTRRARRPNENPSNKETIRKGIIMKAILFSCFLFVILIPYAQAEIYHETVKLKFLSSFALTENIRNNRVMYSMSKNGKPQARYLLQDGGPQERINAKLNSNMCQWYMIASDNQYFHENEEWEVIIVESKSNYKRINPSTPPEGVWPWKPGGNWLTEKTKRGL